MTNNNINMKLSGPPIPTVPFALRLPAELHIALKELGKEEGVSINKLLNSIIVDEIKRRGIPMPWRIFALSDGPDTEATHRLAENFVNDGAKPLVLTDQHEIALALENIENTKILERLHEEREAEAAGECIP